MAGLIILIIGASVSAWSFWSSARRRRAQFGSREQLSGEQLFADYFSDSDLPKQVVLGLWNECADKLRVPASKLRPTDRFKQELAVANFWASLDDPRDDLAHFVREFAKERSTGIDLANSETVGQLVDQLARIEVGRRP
jgi:hypothetical protein